MNEAPSALPLYLHVFDGLGHDLRERGEHMIREDIFRALLDFLATAMP